MSLLSHWTQVFLLMVCAATSLTILGHTPVFGINTRYSPRDTWGYQFKNLYLTRDDGCLDTIDLRNAIIYGLTNRLTVDFTIPYFIRYSPNNRSAGISDVVFKANYVIHERLNEIKNAKLRTFLQDSIRFPTGHALAIPSLGTGTYRNRFGFTADYDTDQYEIYIASIYEFSLTTFKSFRPGDLFEITTTAGIKPSKHTSLITVLDYFASLKNSKNGVSDLSSGGDTLYVGLEAYYLNESIKASGSFQVPAFCNKLKLGPRAGFFVTFYF